VNRLRGQHLVLVAVVVLLYVFAVVWLQHTAPDSFDYRRLAL
jgi:hypothetical protein